MGSFTELEILTIASAVVIFVFTVLFLLGLCVMIQRHHWFKLTGNKEKGKNDDIIQLAEASPKLDADDDLTNDVNRVYNTIDDEQNNPINSLAMPTGSVYIDLVPNDSSYISMNSRQGSIRADEDSTGYLLPNPPVCRSKPNNAPFERGKGGDAQYLTIRSGSGKSFESVKGVAEEENLSQLMNENMAKILADGSFVSGELEFTITLTGKRQKKLQENP